MSLYHITAELSSLLTVIDAAGDTQSPELEQAFAEHAAALREAFDSKADDYAALIRSCETRADNRRAEAKRMQALADSDDKLAERLRSILRDAMTELSRTKVDTQRFRIAVRANGGKTPVIVSDETVIPQQFRVPVYSEKVDKDAIRDALEAGASVPGAALGQRGTRLDIK